MKHTYHIRVRTVLWASLGIVCFASAPAWAGGGHYEDGIFIPDGVCADPRGCDDMSSPFPAPSGPTQEQLRQQRERQRELKRQHDVEWSSDEGMDYFKRGDWDNAIRSFEEALDREPDNEDIAEWLARARSEKAKVAASAVAAPAPKLSATPVPNVEGGDGGGRKCQIVDECIETLDAQREALDGARREQGDLYKAMGTADFEHGRGSVESLGEKIDEQAPSFFVWKNKDQAGFPLYLREYKTTVDEIFAMMGAKRTAALNGMYDPKKTGLAGSSAYGLTPQKVSEKLNAAKAKVEHLAAFAKYMQALLLCSKGPDAGFNRCFEEVNKHFSKALDGLPLDKASMARVKAASAAYTRYSTRALERAQDLSKSASKCFKGCR